MLPVARCWTTGGSWRWGAASSVLLSFVTFPNRLEPKGTLNPAAQVLEHWLQLAVEGATPEAQLSAGLRWLVLPMLEAAHAAGQQLLTPPVLATIFSRIFDPENPANLAGAPCLCIPTQTMGLVAIRSAVLPAHLMHVFVCSVLCASLMVALCRTEIANRTRCPEIMHQESNTPRNKQPKHSYERAMAVFEVCYSGKALRQTHQAAWSSLPIIGNRQGWSTKQAVVNCFSTLVRSDLWGDAEDGAAATGGRAHPRGRPPAGGPPQGKS